MTTIKVRVLKKIFERGAFSICVCALVDDAGTDDGEVVVLGDDIPTVRGVTYKVDGHYEDSRHGRQFRATRFTECVGTSRAEIVAYLVTLDGIGKVTAERIFEAFGTGTPEIIETAPERLTEVPRLTKKAAARLVESWSERRGVQRIYEILAPYGVTTVQCQRLLDIRPTDAEDIAMHYPYILTQVPGITWEIADRRAYDLGVAVDDEARIGAAARAVLIEAECEGSTGMLPRAFIDALKARLDAGRFPSIDRKALCKVANRLALEGVDLKVERGAYTCRTSTRYTEQDLAGLIASVLRETTPPAHLDGRIQQAFNALGLDADKSQTEAIKTVFSSAFSIVTGGPGTGKTSLARAILAIQQDWRPGSTVCLLAPTGKAARRLSESTGLPASTIHSRLKIFEGADTTALEMIRDDLVIIDESSMINLWLAKTLFESIAPSSRVVMIGDAAQLQSVGAGAVFRDIIASDRVPVSRLSGIHRQAAGSAIILSASAIAAGEPSLVEGEDFEIYDHMTDEMATEAIVSQYTRDARRFGAMHIACLAPTCELVDDLNARIQAAVNPAAADKTEITQGGRILRIGDLVMELQNGPQVCNGDVGTIVAVDPADKSVRVAFYGHVTVEYEKAELDQLALAYAMTVHKAQGSEYESVLILYPSYLRHMRRRSVPYTAITRARTICRVYGSKAALQEAILVDDSGDRLTMLADDIRGRVCVPPMQ